MKPEQTLNFSRTIAALGRVVAYYPNIGKALKNKNAAIMICQFIYWEGKAHGPELVKSYAELMDETGLTEREIDNGRTVLKAFKICEGKAKGNPARLHWSFDWNQFNSILNDWVLLTEAAEAEKPEPPKPNARAKIEMPGALYQSAVELYFEFCKKPEIMGAKPLFKPAQGKALKEILEYLKSESPGKDWTESVVQWEFILLSWDLLTDHYKKAVDILDIRRNINNIIKSLNNAGTNPPKKNGRHHNRVNANAAAGYM